MLIDESQNQMLEWNKNISFLRYKNRVVVANRYNGQWMKISRECFDILEEVIGSKIAYKEILGIFKEKDDCDYFKKLLQKLDYMGSFIEDSIYQKNEIEHVYFSLTHRCNLKCIHCSVDASSKFEKDYLDTNEILEILNKILQAGLKTIIFTGGEPLLRKDFNIILEYTRNHFSGKIILMTNGTLINSNNVSFLTNTLDSIDISLDGVDEESCSRIRGKGTFDKVINSINLLQQHRFNNISVSMVLSTYNEPLLDKFYELNKKLETLPIPRVFAELGRGKNSKDEFVLHKEVESNSKVKTKEEYDNDKKELYNTICVCACGANKNQITINYDGNVYPCGLLINDKYKLANIKNIENLNNMFKCSDPQARFNLESIQPENYSECKNCEVNLFCWSCLEVVDKFNGTKDFRDRCKSIKEYLIETIWETEYE